MEKLIAAVDALQVEVAENTRVTQKILTGFPNEDPDGHRRAHEEQIQKMRDQRKLRQELIIHLAKSSTWAALVGVAVVFWFYVKANLK